MKHVEAVIRMFEPGYDVRRITARRRNRANGLFKRGTLFRGALDTLRNAAGPLTTREIVEAMLAAKGAPEPSKKQVHGLSSRCRRSCGITTAGPWPASGKVCQCGGASSSPCLTFCLVTH
jgi:hypothetical protein